MKAFLVFFFLVASAIAIERPVIDRFVQPSGFQRLQNLIRSVRYAKIVGGVESTANSRPYQAGLFISLAGGTGFCGGSLVSRNFVLTAGHCKYDGVNNASSFTVVLGAHKIYEEETGSLRIQSNEAILHPDWNPSTLQNDLCLIKLPVQVTLTPKIQLSILPPKSAVDELFVGYESLISGWGKPADNVNSIADTLREVQVEVITKTTCNRRYLGSIIDSHICTDGSGGKSSCNGDSGGPLVLQYKNQTIQVGIVSFGIALGCEVGWPSVFTRTTSFLDWISTTAGVPLLP